jgi:hypothetical protein
LFGTYLEPVSLLIGLVESSNVGGVCFFDKVKLKLIFGIG